MNLVIGVSSASEVEGLRLSGNSGKVGSDLVWKSWFG